MKRGKKELLFADHLSIHIRSQISLKDLKALKIQISSQDQDSEKKKKNHLTAISLYKDISIRSKI